MFFSIHNVIIAIYSCRNLVVESVSLKICYYELAPTNFRHVFSNGRRGQSKRVFGWCAEAAIRERYKLWEEQFSNPKISFQLFGGLPLKPPPLFKWKDNFWDCCVRSESGVRPEARYSITTDPNAYAEVQSHCALRAARSLSFLEIGSSKGQYFCTKINFFLREHLTARQRSYRAREKARRYATPSFVFRRRFATAVSSP